jgi:hypothetical protein
MGMVNEMNSMKRAAFQEKGRSNVGRRPNFEAGVVCQEPRPREKTMEKKKKKLEKGKEARRRARAAGAAPAGTRVIQDKRKKLEKHKRPWMEEGDVGV